MTTKPKHTTCRHRHTTDSRISKARTQAEQAERDLAQALREHYGDKPTKTEAFAFRCITVRWSVRHSDGGLPFLFEYKAKPGAWESAAEHEATKAIKQAGLIAWAHLETVNPEVSV